MRQRYFGALLAEEQERLTEQSIARLQQTLRETRARHREGFASDDELLRLEVQLANLDSNLLQARNRVATARGALLVAMSEDPLQAVALQGTLSELRLAPEATNSPANADLLAAAGAGPLLATGAEQLRRIAMTNRSDLRQLRTLHTLGELQLTIQEAAYLPTIRAFGSVDFGTADDDDDAEFGAPIGASGYSQWRLSAAAGLAVQWQLFSGFARDARVAQRREELRQSAARLRQTEPGGAASGAHLRRLVAGSARPRGESAALDRARATELQHRRHALWRRGRQRAPGNRGRGYPARVAVRLRPGGIRLPVSRFAARVGAWPGAAGRCRARGTGAVSRWARPSSGA